MKITRILDNTCLSTFRPPVLKHEMHVEFLGCTNPNTHKEYYWILHINRYKANTFRKCVKPMKRNASHALD